jgi:peptide/nickel transport system substrate-binding protein
MQQFYSGDPSVNIAQKENQWSGNNLIRWQNADFNKWFDIGVKELDPQKNAEAWIRANDVVVEQAAIIPLINRKGVNAKVKTLDTANNETPFDSATRNIADWKRVG